MNTATHSTLEFDDSRFKQHGHALVSFDGRIMRFESTGPFNAEHLIAGERTIRALLKECPPPGPHYDLIRVHGSAQFAIDVLSTLERQVASLLADGLLSAGTAIVDEEGAEGFALMYPPFAAVYGAHGDPVASFSSYAEAEAWIAAIQAGQK